MRTDSLRRLACPVPGCAGALSPSLAFAPTLDPAVPGELVEAVLACGGCGSEYPVILGVALLEIDLQSYLWAFWDEIERCSATLDGTGISRNMRSYLGIPSFFTGQPGPPPHDDAGLGWTVAPYIQAHFDAGSLSDDLPAGWWREAVEEHRSGERGPYEYLLGTMRSLIAPPVAGLAVEVGCSVGRGSAELAAAYEYAVGVDRSFSAVLTARRLLLGRPAPLASYPLEREKGRWESMDLQPPNPVPNLEFVVASGDALPVPPAGAACAAALNVLCALGDPKAMMAELARVLRPGGLLVLSSPYWADSNEGGDSPFAFGGPEFLNASMEGDYELVAEQDMVPWLVRLARRRWNVYLCHCVVAARSEGGRSARLADDQAN